MQQNFCSWLEETNTALYPPPLMTQKEIKLRMQDFIEHGTNKITHESLQVKCYKMQPILKGEGKRNTERRCIMSSPILYLLPKKPAMDPEYCQRELKVSLVQRLRAHAHCLRGVHSPPGASRPCLPPNPKPRGLEGAQMWVTEHKARGWGSPGVAHHWRCMESPGHCPWWSARGGATCTAACCDPSSEGFPGMAVG